MQIKTIVDKIRTWIITCGRTWYQMRILLKSFELVGDNFFKNELYECFGECTPESNVGTLEVF